jgi:hypothetical protein
MLKNAEHAMHISIVALIVLQLMFCYALLVESCETMQWWVSTDAVMHSP